MKKNEVITNELKEIAPVLSGIDSVYLYTMPADYLPTLSATIVSQIRSIEVAEELAFAAPLIATIEKSECKEVPAAYFSTFPDAMLHLAVYEHKEHPATLLSWRTKWEAFAERLLGSISRPQYNFAMASVASVLLILGMVWSTKNHTTDDKFFAQLEQLPDHEIHGYVAHHHDEFEEHIILHHINDTEFSHATDSSTGSAALADDIID